MTNPIFGFQELAAAQAQPHVLINQGDRVLAKAIAGMKTINFESDEDYVLVADANAPEDDDWPHQVIRMTDTETVLTAARNVLYPDLDDEYGDSNTQVRPVFVFVNDTTRALTIKGDGTGATGVTVAAGESSLVRFTGADIEQVAAGGGGSNGGTGEVILQLAVSEWGEALQAGAGAAYLRSPKAFEITEVRASLYKEDSAEDIEVDILVDGESIFASGPLLTIDAGDKTSTTSESTPTIDDGAVPDDGEIVIDIDGPSGLDAEGLIVTLIGTPS